MALDWFNVGCYYCIRITIRFDKLTQTNKKFFNELSFVLDYSNYKLI